jgi:catechol 2,3-dioxygenase-like lactoylglutathione lyase family enzyme
MAFHHVALATNDLSATHAFYTEAMGFELVKSVVAPTDAPGGWAKHVFYGTGGDGLIAFWELHDERVGSFDPSISTGLGLPVWVNHVAFAAADPAELERRREHWLDRGIDVMEVDHGFCRSIYTTDPNGILVEWCTDTAPYTAADRERALTALAEADPARDEAPQPVFHRGRRPASTAGGQVPAGVGAEAHAVDGG